MTEIREALREIQAQHEAEPRNRFTAEEVGDVLKAIEAHHIAGH